MRLRRTRLVALVPAGLRPVERRDATHDARTLILASFLFFTACGAPPEPIAPSATTATPTAAASEPPPGSADAAVAAYQPGFKRRLKLATPRPARKGWDERRVYAYETSPNERLAVFAGAMRHGEAWTVLLIDAAQPTLEKRAAAVQLVGDSLRPGGYTRET